MNEVEDVDQDTAPRDISIRVKGRYPGSQDLIYRLPMNWRIHSGISGYVHACLPLRGQPRYFTWFPFNSTQEDLIK